MNVRRKYLVTLHVSVWVEIRTLLTPANIRDVTLHVSVWVEIICDVARTADTIRHAPRERVSWNSRHMLLRKQRRMSRSTWACELKYLPQKFGYDRARSRSTWACELKLQKSVYNRSRKGHAPRERVSWNLVQAQSERPEATSRSTWACELKSMLESDSPVIASHAPRERVSWNSGYAVRFISPRWSRSTWACELKFVQFLLLENKRMSRSTWACELKCAKRQNVLLHIDSHAPRERVSWNSLCLSRAINASRHAPRERVSWNS